MSNYIDDADVAAQKQANRKSFELIVSRLKREIDLYGKSLCGHYYTKQEVDRVFAKSLESGKFD